MPTGTLRQPFPDWSWQRLEPSASSDIPYLKYEIDYSPGQSATITFINPSGPDVVYEDVPLSGAVLWPGASENPSDWPGWILDDGVWVEADDGFLWARGTVNILFEVNPSTMVTVSYQQGTGACADPDPDEVAGTVITPPTTRTRSMVLMSSPSPASRMEPWQSLPLQSWHSVA